MPRNPEQPQRRGAKRTAILLSLLALGVYAVFFLKHLV